MCHAQVLRSISEILRFAQNDRIMSKCDESQAGCLCHNQHRLIEIFARSLTEFALILPTLF